MEYFIPHRASVLLCTLCIRRILTPNLLHVIGFTKANNDFTQQPTFCQAQNATCCITPAHNSRLDTSMSHKAAA